MILAGAGNGKTTTITARIVYMVEKEGIDSSRILALTFSKEAARNMHENVEKLLLAKKDPRKNFQPYCIRIIQTNAVYSIRVARAL